MNTKIQETITSIITTNKWWQTKCRIKIHWSWWINRTFWAPWRKLFCFWDFLSVVVIGSSNKMQLLFESWTLEFTWNTKSSDTASRRTGDAKRPSEQFIFSTQKHLNTYHLNNFVMDNDNAVYITDNKNYLQFYWRISSNTKVSCYT